MAMGVGSPAATFCPTSSFASKTVSARPDPAESALSWTTAKSSDWFTTSISITEVVELPLTDEELAELRDAADAVRSKVAELSEL